MPYVKRRACPIGQALIVYSAGTCHSEEHLTTNLLVPGKPNLRSFAFAQDDTADRYFIRRLRRSCIRHHYDHRGRCHLYQRSGYTQACFYP